jgi:OOP family OmpA-OmpF porin
MDDYRALERRWFATLPVRVVVVLCAAIAVLTGLLSLAPQDDQRPEARPRPAEPAASAAAAPPPASAASAAHAVLKASQLFAYASDQLAIQEGSEARRALATCAAERAGGRIAVTGHTDCIGSDDYNRALSARRAAAIRRYLVGLGVPEDAIDARGMGRTLAMADAACRPPIRKSTALAARLEKFRRVDLDCGAPAAA